MRCACARRSDRAMDFLSTINLEEAQAVINPSALGSTNCP